MGVLFTGVPWLHRALSEVSIIFGGFIKAFYDSLRGL